MSEVISRQDATTIPVMPKEHREYQTMNLDDAYEQGWFDCQKCIEELPSADLSDYCDKLWKLAYERGKAEGQPRKGKWVKDNYGNTVCSECLGIRRDNRINYINFCNQCGADMREQKLQNGDNDTLQSGLMNAI